MGAASEVEMLVARAQFMRESLGKSQSVTDSMITILGSFDHRLSTLETAMRPTQVAIPVFLTFVAQVLPEPPQKCLRSHSLCLFSLFLSLLLCFIDNHGQLKRLPDFSHAQFPPISVRSLSSLLTVKQYTQVPQT